jgi:hypothetical protein
MTARILTLLALAALAATIVAPTPAAAQTGRRVDSQRGAELSLFGGAGIGGSGAGAAFGWSLGWRPSDRLAIEGSGTWTGEPDVDGFAAIFGPRVYLGSTGRAAAFVSAEAGLFHASVNGVNPDTPEFYLNRMPGVPVEKAFNDFVAGAGGGVDLRVRGRLWMRPQVRMLFVIDGWTTHLVAVPGVHFTYRFTAPSSTP